MPGPTAILLVANSRSSANHGLKQFLMVAAATPPVHPTSIGHRFIGWAKGTWRPQANVGFAFFQRLWNLNRFAGWMSMSSFASQRGERGWIRRAAWIDF